MDNRLYNIKPASCCKQEQDSDCGITINLSEEPNSEYLLKSEAFCLFLKKGQYALISQLPDTTQFVKKGYADRTYLTKDALDILELYVTIAYFDENIHDIVESEVESTTYSKNQIDTALSLKADISSLADVATSGSYDDLQNTPTNVSQFTNDAGYLTEHQDISGKADKSEMSVVPGTGANADKTTITLKQGASATVLTAHQDISGKANTADLASLVNTGTYNSTSKKIELKHDNNVLAEIDATAFIKDGMVDSVVVSNGYIVITFNTDAGKETIRIPVTDIFDPSNYYDKDDVDGLLAGKVDKENGKGLSANDYTTADKDKLNALPTATELTQELESKADVGRVEDIEDALSVVESETADATDYTTETTSVSTDNITINPVAVRKSPIYSVYKQGGGQENIEGVFSPGYTDGSYILNVQIAQAGTVKIDSIRTRYYSGYYAIVYFYFTPTGGEKVKVAEIAKASAGTATGNKYEEPTVSINAPGAGVLSIELWLYDIDTYNTIPAFYWMEYERSSVVFYAITSIIFEQSSLTGFVNNGAYNSTTKKIELKHDSDILAEIDATDIFDSDNYYDKNDVNGLLAGKADSAGLAPVATSGSYNDLSDKPDLSSFITRSVDDLTNYYLKSETYTKNEVLQLIGAIQQFHYEVHATLPQTGVSNVLYLIGPAGTGTDKYEEYVYANNDWTKIGDTSIDLSGYVTTQALNTALADYVTSSALSTTLANYYNKTEVDGLFAGKEDITPIVAVASGTTAINASVNTYYEVAGEVGALTITLPTPTDLTKVSMVVIHLTAGTNPNVVIGSAETIDYSAAYDISASKEYEINCLFNGDKWIVADMEVI